MGSASPTDGKSWWQELDLIYYCIASIWHNKSFVRDESVNEWLYFLLIFDVKLFHDQIFGWITFFFIVKVVFDYCRKGLVDGFEILHFHLIKVYRNLSVDYFYWVAFWNKKTMEWKGRKLFLYFLYPQWIGFCRGRKTKDQAIIFSFLK